MQKEDIRQKMRAKRDGLSEKKVHEASIAVCDRLIGMDPLKDAKVVLVYADFNNEIQTGMLTGWLLFQGKQVALPLVEDGEMSAVDYKGTMLKVNGFGIAQPISGAKIINPETIDVVICPGLAFSKSLVRLGFGKGYYDRFLPRAKNACCIGLAYDFQIVDYLDADAHDVRMRYVVTPRLVLS